MTPLQFDSVTKKEVIGNADGSLRTTGPDLSADLAKSALLEQVDRQLPIILRVYQTLIKAKITSGDVTMLLITNLMTDINFHSCLTDVRNLPSSAVVIGESLQHPHMRAR